MRSFAEGTPTVEVTLAGKAYTLGFTIGAMRRAQELGVLNINVEDGTAFMLAMPAYVWSCLTEDARRELSVSDIEELINPTNVRPVVEAVGKLFRASMPEEEGASGNASPAAVETPTAGARGLISSDSGPLVSTTSA